MDPTDAMDVLGASPGGGLHPLIPTSSLRPNEVSVDTGKGSWGAEGATSSLGWLVACNRRRRRADRAQALHCLPCSTGVDHQCHGFDEDMGVARVFGRRRPGSGRRRGGRAAGGPRERRPGWEGHEDRSAALALHSPARTAVAARHSSCTHRPLQSVPRFHAHRLTTTAYTATTACRRRRH